MSSLDVDTASLATELQSALRGEVRFDEGSRALFSTDSSNYRQIPLGLVVPRNAEDVIATLAVCRRHRAPVLSRGGGASTGERPSCYRMTYSLTSRDTVDQARSAVTAGTVSR